MAVILVEGVSDQLAVEALAARRGRDLAAEGVRVVAIGGAGNVRRALAEHDGHVVALVDAAQADDFRRAGVESPCICNADLEDELIRCLGIERVQQVIEEQGELARLRTFQGQPEWRTRPVEAQLRRFLGTRGGRKIQYAPALVHALDLANVPRPLDRVLGGYR